MDKTNGKENINRNSKSLQYEISCGAYVIDEDKILMVRHKNGGHWDFPKGHVEKGESKKETAIREVKEETGIDIKITSDKEYKITYMPQTNVEKEVIFFEAIKVGGTINKQQSEILEIEWIKITEAIEKITFENSRKLFERFIDER